MSRIAEGRKSQHIFRFLKFRVYKDSKVFRNKVKKISQTFPDKEKYVLTQQLLRALDSILLNIAEGSGKYTDLDFRKFLSIAFGSLNEVLACLDLALDDKYITMQQFEALLTEAEGIAKQLRSFSGKLNNGLKDKRV